MSSMCLLRKATKLLLMRQRSQAAAIVGVCRNFGGTASEEEQSKQRGGEQAARSILYGALTAGGIGVGYFIFDYLAQQRLGSDEPSTKSNASSSTVAAPELDDKALARLWHKTARDELPTYALDEVQSHNTVETGIWVTYGLGVYDVTTFVDNHPGGDKILMAAGSAIDPFWAIYQQHNTLQVLELLESYRIGNLAKSDVVSVEDQGSPWANEPKRHALLKPAAERPFNAEPPLGMLAEKFYTPNELFYIRNHLPVPTLQDDDYGLEIEISAGKHAGTAERTLSFEDIKRLPKHTVTAAIMCGGNRRSEMTRVKPVKGLSWGAGAVGNAKWSGARLSDLLVAMGVQPDERLHVIFEGADLDPTAHPYAASIPLSKALDPRGDVILAYEMNDEPLTRDHGFPIRAIVPGVVGARNVKWLTRIVVSDQESDSHWQQNDYKGFSPSTDWDTVDFSLAAAIQAMPVTSAICTPMPDERVRVSGDGHITVRGYAWSGGGRRIVRVDLTADAGATWHVAELEQEDLPDGRHYGWSLWTARIPVKEQQKELEIWAKAVDSAYNVQPESFENIWNLRGVLSNAYHRVKVKLIREAK
ncbi:probable sulfite oxidase, mitochondrial [Scaptodrosophila lebanonensis]|uniref:sulfite oxidase n=1 Tax=Drosophila lebanonensis TaxID=7225 RepID=A0A6J2U123_DROLE|nr:probable sulfite oxidase, mitochondrial [Scaptodrosophila lebanonensis]